MPDLYVGGLIGFVLGGIIGTFLGMTRGSRRRRLEQLRSGAPLEPESSHPSSDPRVDALARAIAGTRSEPISAARGPSPEAAKLRQDLRLKVMYDEIKVDDLINFERLQDANRSEEDLMKAAIYRWERANH
jgi:hypothetical protein